VNGEKYESSRNIESHTEALEQILDFFDKYGPELSEDNLLAVGHRVVHGGDRFDRAAIIDEVVEKEIDHLSALAPLHYPPALEGIKTEKTVFSNTPHVAVFDTAFHQTLPEANYTYAIEDSIAKKYGIRRYGFHGTSHEYVAGEAEKFLNKKPEDTNLIILHLGSGGSATAIKNGKSYETSMGLTPLAGLVMETRSGDIDPAVVFHLNRQAGMTLEQIDELFNKSSGIHGINNGVSDMRDVVAAVEKGDPKAKLALDVYKSRIHHYLGAYFVSLGHVDAIVLTAGVGEHNPMTRTIVFSDLEESLGITIDEKKNYENDGDVFEPVRVITTKSSKIPVLVIPTNEELAIARQSAEAVK
jgi:acetate kinase